MFMIVIYLIMDVPEVPGIIPKIIARIKFIFGLTHPIKEKVTSVDPACPACRNEAYRSCYRGPVASENGTRIAQVDGTGVQTKRNKWKNL
jgi:hypothetical protein